MNSVASFAIFTGVKKIPLPLSLCLALLLGACHVDQAVAPRPTWYSSNGRAELVGSLTRHDAFATYTLSTTAPALTLRAGTNLAETFSGMGQLVAVVDGTPWRTFAVRSNDEKFTLRLDSVPGPHKVELREGGQIRAHEVGDVGFTSLLSVSAPEGYKVDSVPTSYTAGLVVWGDSRTVGGGCATPALQAWPVLLRKQLPATEIFTPGYGSLTLGKHIDTPAHRAEVVQDIVRRLKPYTTQAVWFEAGVNDFLTGEYTPAQLADYYQALLPALHAALPGAKIYLQTDAALTNEAANKAGYTLAQYREGEAAGAAGLPYIQVVDGTRLGTTADLSADGVHLDAAGEARFAYRAQAALRF